MKIHNRRYLLIVLISIFCLGLNAQINFPEKGEVFRDDVVPRVDIIIPSDSLDYILDSDNVESNYHFHATFIFDNGTIRDTLEDIGFRLRGNTSRTSGKKSFKISFNTYVQGREYYGLEKLNLNGEHNDPSIIRSKLGWDIAAQNKLVGSRANHVLLYINDEFFGVYINVEHIDEEFLKSRFGNDDGNLYKCLWPADFEYLGNNPDLYKLEVFGRQVYQLKTNVAANDYSNLAQFIFMLNNANTSSLPCQLEKLFNVDDYLKFIAFDILTGNWDGPIYNKNNFYLYENPATGLIEYIPYDLDNTFGIDWFQIDWAQRDIYNWSHSNQDRPIYEKILAVPEYRNRFSYYLNQMMNEIFVEDNLNPHLDSLRNKIAPWAEIDTYAMSDYGYTHDDFLDSYTQSVGGHVKYGLKEFITERRNNSISQLDLQNINPIISQLKNSNSNALQDIVITASIEDEDLSTVTLHYFLEGQTDTMMLQMWDNGNHGDSEAGDGIYGGIIPPLESSNIIHYFITAVDVEGLESRNPRCLEKELAISEPSLQLYINEIMTSNNNTIADEAGEYDDWIEIYNGGGESIYLGDKYLSDNPSNPNKLQMPDISIASGEYLLFWADKDEDQGDFHTNFKLSSSGEFVGIFDSDDNNNNLIDGNYFGRLDADASLSRLPDGIGYFQLAMATPRASNAPLSIFSIINDNVIDVFPNPTNGFVNINSTFEFFEMEWQLNIFDATGRKIRSEEIRIPSQIDFSEQPSGLYFLQIITEYNNAITKKVVVR